MLMERQYVIFLWSIRVVYSNGTSVYIQCAYIPMENQCIIFLWNIHVFVFLGSISVFMFLWSISVFIP